MNQIAYDKESIRRLREKRGWKLGDLAMRAGITVRTLSYIEKGFSDPRATTLAKIASALGVTVNQMFHRVYTEDTAERAS